MDLNRKTVNITLTHSAARLLRNLIADKMGDAVQEMAAAPTNDRRSAAITYGQRWADLYEIINDAMDERG